MPALNRVGHRHSRSIDRRKPNEADLAVSHSALLSITTLLLIMLFANPLPYIKFRLNNEFRNLRKAIRSCG